MVSDITQPLSEEHAQFELSCDMPRLCPISWAMVEATAMGFVLWSFVKKKNIKCHYIIHHNQRFLSNIRKVKCLIY